MISTSLNTKTTTGADRLLQGKRAVLDGSGVVYAIEPLLLTSPFAVAEKRGGQLGYLQELPAAAGRSAPEIRESRGRNPSIKGDRR
jgi:hypothetical protein